MVTFSTPVTMAADSVALQSETDNIAAAELAEIINSIREESCQVDGNTVTLLRRVNLEEALLIPEGTEIVLNLGGYSVWNWGDNGGEAICVPAGAKITISGDGSVEGSDGGAGIYNEGTLIIENAEITGGDDACGIYNTGELTINSGSIEGGRIRINNETLCGVGVYNCKNFTMNGGYVSGGFSWEESIAGGTGIITTTENDAKFYFNSGEVVGGDGFGDNGIAIEGTFIKGANIVVMESYDRYNSDSYTVCDKNTSDRPFIKTVEMSPAVELAMRINAVQEDSCTVDTDAETDTVVLKKSLPLDAVITIPESEEILILDLDRYDKYEMCKIIVPEKCLLYLCNGSVKTDNGDAIENSGNLYLKNVYVYGSNAKSETEYAGNGILNKGYVTLESGSTIYGGNSLNDATKAGYGIETIENGKNVVMQEGLVVGGKALDGSGYRNAVLGNITEGSGSYVQVSENGNAYRYCSGHNSFARYVEAMRENDATAVARTIDAIKSESCGVYDNSVRLYNDLELNETLELYGENVEISLENHTIKANGCNAIEIVDGANITLNGGSIIGGDGAATGYSAIVNNGTLSLENITAVGGKGTTGGNAVVNNSQFILNAGKLTGGEGTETDGIAVQGEIIPKCVVKESNDGENYSLITKYSSDKKYLITYENDVEFLLMVINIITPGSASYIPGPNEDNPMDESIVRLTKDVHMSDEDELFINATVDFAGHTIYGDIELGGVQIYGGAIEGTLTVCGGAVITNMKINGGIDVSDANWITISNSEIKGNQQSAIFAYEHTELDQLIINGGKIIGADGENGYPAIWFSGEERMLLRDGAVIINGAAVKGGNAESASGSGGSAIKIELKYEKAENAVVMYGGNLIGGDGGSYGGNALEYIYEEKIPSSGGGSGGSISGGGSSSAKEPSLMALATQVPLCLIQLNGGIAEGGYGTVSDGVAIQGLIDCEEDIILKESTDGNNFTVIDGNTSNCRYVKAVPLNPVEKITLDRERIVLTAWDWNAFIEVTTYPSDALTNLIWTSSDMNVVTVEEGNIFRKGPGKATVTVRTADGLCSASCMVIVPEIDFEITDDNNIIFDVEYGEDEQEGTVVAALYSSEGKMLSIDFYDISRLVSVELPGYEDGCYVQVVRWDDDATPLGKLVLAADIF